MELKQKIIDTAMMLMNLLEHYGDEQFAEIICEAVYSYDMEMLLNLEETLGE